MIHEHVHHGGRVRRLADTRLSPGQAGLFNGWGLFTTVRIYDGVPFAFDRHWRRLAGDAARTHTPFDFTEQETLEALLDLVAANEVHDGTGRLYFPYSLGGPWHSNEDLPETDRLICTADLPPRPSAARLAIQPNGRHAAHPLAGTKVLAWLPNNWLLARARAAGFDETILLNERGEVSECTSANVFVVFDGTAFTPPLASGCLAGVTRDVLLEAGPAAGIAVVERTLRADEVLGADEVFITSTTREVLAVREIDGDPPSHPDPDGAVTAALARAFSEYVKRHVS